MDVDRMRALQENGPVIDVQINGQPARGLIDTGAKVTCVSPKMADRIRLHDTGLKGYYMGKESPIYKGSLIIAGKRFEDCELHRYPISPDQEFDILIGRDLLVSFIFEYRGSEGKFSLR